MAPSEFDAFCREAFDLLSASGVPHLLIGGLAVIALGEARATADVDVVAFASSVAAERLVQQAAAAGFEASLEVERERMQKTGTMRFRKGRFQLDIILASLPFEDAALSRSTKKRMFGRMVPLPTPEDLLLFKVLAGRDKDMLDAVGIARRNRSRLDRRYLETSLQAVCEMAEDTTAWRRLETVLRKAERDT
jgi:hypothetical protein